ncbi:MAG: transcriptional repressor NrdR [Deltaproteobacteria bacterium]|nr:transcriptional repressor NrdR [Deltaproteobacteria bacterium]
MRCPYCKCPSTKVVDSREVRGGEEIRRRRLCDTTDGGCGHRFTTFERLELRLPVVVKRDGGRVPFEREKVRNGLLRATWKRRVREEEIEAFLDDLERRLSENVSREVTTQEIGSEAVRFLARVDPVACVRFQSVYGDFRSIDEFKRLLSELGGGDE